MSNLMKIFNKKSKISMITCYDYSFAKILSKSNIDAILVGDSLGCTMQGFSTTLSVTVDEMIYHAKCVKRAINNKPIIVDMPFSSYQVSIKDGMNSAFKIMKEALCDGIKVEGGSEYICELILRLVESGIPVMGHLGFTPQSIHQIGGNKIQGKSIEDGKQIYSQAKNLEKSNIFSLVLELIPSELAKNITQTINIPTIGIGAGQTNGQILVLQDLLGMDKEFQPKFLKKYSNLYEVCLESFNHYHKEVQEEIFPDENYHY